MCKVYGYCRVSTVKQSIERQVRKFYRFIQMQIFVRKFIQEQNTRDEKNSRRY